MFNTRIKEAIKAALAIVLTYWIALSASWLNPHWAALTVAMIALPTVKETVRMGLHRLFGIFPACIVALVIIHFAAQDRWLFVTLACIWIFFTTYLKQLDRSRDIFWQIAGFTALLILASSTSSTAYFSVAIYRTLETGMGVVVYSLVAIYVWPLSDSEEQAASAPPPPPQSKRFPTWQLILIDRDLLVRSLFAALCPFAGFLVWVYFDPAGHVGWFMVMGALGMIIAPMPFIRASMLVVPLGVFLGLALLLYVFVLPRLESFYQLGALIFVLIFCNSYFLKGVPRILGAMAIVLELSIRNEQVYNFPAMANTYVFILLTFLFVYVLSYMMGSARPEKQVLRKLRRFFKAAAHITSADYGRSGLLHYLDDLYCVRETQTIPRKIMPWVKSIPLKCCPDNTAEKTEPLLKSLAVLSPQLLTIADRSQLPQAHVETLQCKVTEALLAWSGEPDLPVELLPTNEGAPFSGVLHSAQGYAQAARDINWSQWREERFS
ncbi:FUSC family protein [Cerasicoccus frondis]|uniref:FUSC family protein n=1 Tax=Cerasicoccus frondis TaxID=490090 RepID=UPI0028525AF3|nr:FUSC family protein [Cerasicoccus frondis]